MKEVWADMKAIGFVLGVITGVMAICYPRDTWQFILEIIKVIKGG